MSSIAGESPFSREGPQYPVKMETRGSPKYYKNRDPDPHFRMKMGTRGPQFGGPHFHMTPVSPAMAGPDLSVKGCHSLLGMRNKHITLGWRGYFWHFQVHIWL